VSALAFGLVGEALARALNPTLWTVSPSSKTASSGAAPSPTPVDLAASDAPAGLTATPVNGFAADPAAVLTVSHLSVRFPGPDGAVTVVDDVSFALARGEFVGVVGESGSGKTMTTLAIAQLVPYPGTVAGAVTLNGQSLRELSGPALRALLGTSLANVFQDPMSALNPALKIGTQMTESLETHRHLSHREATAAALDALREVNIPIPERQLERHPHELSGGMRQRVILATGLLNEPDLLIADEPTTALDVTVQAQIMDVLAEINQTHGTAVILVSHNIGLISQNCHRALVMYAGRIVEDLTIEQMRSDPQHPYTRALISAVPDMSRPRDERLETIPGQAADPSNLPTGCPFHPRCPLATARCAAERPVLQDRPDGRRVACLVVNADLRQPEPVLA
jgi:oligopeptide/dipeptide ABC transporter ATP-binding protein